MKTKYILGLSALAAFVTSLLLVPILAQSKQKEPEPQIQVVTVEVPQPHLSVSQIIWLARLMDCESGIKSSAINPNDVDSTPSYGILQFKPGTFKHFAAVYGIEGELMDAEAQVAIAEQWLLGRDSIRWSGQFPACVRKIGTPPPVGSSTASQS